MRPATDGNIDYYDGTGSYKPTVWAPYGVFFVYIRQNLVN